MSFEPLATRCISPILYQINHTTLFFLIFFLYFSSLFLQQSAASASALGLGTARLFLAHRNGLINLADEVKEELLNVGGSLGRAERKMGDENFAIASQDERHASYHSMKDEPQRPARS